MSTAQDSVRIFVSYSHKDPQYLGDDSLLGFLKGLGADGDVDFWTDERIAAGSLWDDEIRNRLESSDIALVLVSQAFLDSPYCTRVEIGSFLDACRQRGMVIIPIVLSPCEWERHQWLATRQFLPGGDETVEEHYSEPGKLKRLFLRIRTELREAVENVRRTRAAAAPPATAEPPVFAERRQLTYLQCNLLPLEPNGAPLDPGDASEVLHELMPEFIKASDAIVSKYNGYIAGSGGGGPLVCFGYPDPSEDDSRRAVRAGLELVTRIAGLSARFVTEMGVALATRVAVHTGWVVIGGERAHADLSLGDAVTTVMMLEREAPAGSVVVSASTLPRVEAFFEVEPAGSIRIPGTETTVEYHRVVADLGFESRFEAAAAQRTLTPIIGREKEIDLILGHWQKARRGNGSVVMLAAEAGVGKSRLLKAVRAQLDARTSTWLEYRCSPYYRDTALHPVLEAVRESCGITPEMSDREKASRIRQALAGLGSAVSDLAPILIQAVCGLSTHTAERALAAQTPLAQKENTIQALAEWLEALALTTPAVLAVEDLHWADPTTIELLDLLIEQAPTLPLLILVTFRPEYAPPAGWMGREYVSQIALGKLARPEVERLILSIAGGKALPPAVTDEIVAKTDGFPLFVEDLTRMVIETDLVVEQNGAYELVGPFQSLAIPTTLYETIMARLAKLATAKPIAQLGATIGREFVYEMLRAVANLDDEYLKRELDRLVAAGLLYRRGLLSRAKYIFKHALVQEALHESLLKRQRKLYHKLVAETLEEKFPEVVRDEPELVARHYLEAELADKAATYYLAAAENALAQSANLECLGHTGHALAMIERLAQGEERMRLELDVRCVQGSALVAARGWASQELGENYARARELSDALPGTPHRWQVLKGQCLFCCSSARLIEACAIGEEMLRIATRDQNPPLQLEARGSLCFANFWRGRLYESIRYCREGLAAYDPARHHLEHVMLFGEDPGTNLYTFGAMSLATAGLEDQARAINDQAMAAYDVYSQVHSRCYLLAGVLFTALQMRDAARVMEFSHRLLTIANEHRYPTWIGIATPMRGWALTTLDMVEQGIAMIKAGREGWRATGGRLHSSQYPALIAEAYMSVGKHTEAKQWLETGFADAAECSETYYFSELWRLKGEWLLQTGGSADDADACYERSLAVAAEQQALTFELRTEASRAELRKDTTRLREVMGRFTESLDSWDMRRAVEVMQRTAD